ncbi:early nodulin-93 [Tripterygium wilfordii]|uniref:Early nodulin-93 n=1 Tax=Tripterygium wilfordii TaxID=458696 RepID=A0A7J7BWD0_TRIWF|nr:early nodulin-93-like [Tripterygium wilfordii]KAF5726181.1 early nodulin-93 [Tripterygium wilfordii]
MGIPTEMRDFEDAKLERSRNSTQEGLIAGSKAAFVTAIATAVPVLAAVRYIPWAKASLNHTGQALIISSVTVASFFITADKTILEGAKRNTHYKTT